MRRETESGTLPDIVVVSSGNSSLTRTGASLRATMPRGWKISSRHDAIICFGGVHALVERLHHEVIAVAIHNERGQQVGFGVNHAIGIGIADEGLAMRFGCAQAAKVEIAIDLLNLTGQHAQSDLRRGTVVRRAQRTAARVDYFNDFAWLGA